MLDTPNVCRKFVGKISNALRVRRQNKLKKFGKSLNIVAGACGFSA